MALQFTSMSARPLMVSRFIPMGRLSFSRMTLHSPRLEPESMCGTTDRKGQRFLLEQQLVATAGRLIQIRH